jgi:hypothetical protein
MRPNLFNADIAGKIHNALASKVLPATLTRPVPGARDANALAGGPAVGATSTAWPCKGFCAEYNSREFDGTKVRFGDRKIILLGKSLPDDIDPQPGDKVIIEGKVWEIVNRVERDPAGATFTCQGRR